MLIWNFRHEIRHKITPSLTYMIFRNTLYIEFLCLQISKRSIGCSNSLFWDATEIISYNYRYDDPTNPVKKNLIPPIPAYENWVECQTVSELEAIQGNNNSLHMEALTIRERILGPHNPEVPHPVIYRGAVFADNARFDRCLELWLHALKLRQKNYVSVVKDLLRFAQVFSQMLHVGVKVSYSHVVEVLSAAISELERNKEKLVRPGPKDDPETVLVICLFISLLVSTGLRSVDRKWLFTLFGLVCFGGRFL